MYFTSLYNLKHSAAQNESVTLKIKFHNILPSYFSYKGSFITALSDAHLLPLAAALLSPKVLTGPASDVKLCGIAKEHVDQQHPRGVQQIQNDPPRTMWSSILFANNTNIHTL